MLIAEQALYTIIAIVARYLSRKRKKPVIVMYGHQLSGNLKALYMEWQRGHQDRFDCYFLSLDPVYSQQLREQKIRVLRCNRLRDMILVGRSNAIITDHGLLAMSPLVRFTSILFIDVWHGIPFKGFRPNDFRLQHRYDEVWVSSPLLKDIYETKFGFQPDIVKSLGYARTDELFLQQPPDPLLSEKAAIPAGQKVVLYAPTWQQDDNGRELFPFGESQDSFIRRLSETCDQNNAVLIIRSHLNTSISAQHFETVRYCSMREFPDSEGLLLLTDVLICDWSSIAFDFLALNKPTLFLDVPSPFKNGFSLGKDYRFGKVVGTLESLDSELKRCLNTPKLYFNEQGNKHQRVTLDAYHTHTDGHASARQLDRLYELIRT
jgi:CDP-glycerol glycerophosphotransferase